MNPSIREIVSAFEAEQRQKNAVARAEKVARNAAYMSDQNERDAVVAEIVAEFESEITRAGLEQSFHSESDRKGDRTFRDSRLDSTIVLVLRVGRHTHTGQLRYDVGTRFEPHHRDYLCNNFVTTDLTEFKVKLAQHLGVRIANRAS